MLKTIPAFILSLGTIILVLIPSQLFSLPSMITTAISQQQEAKAL